MPEIAACGIPQRSVDGYVIPYFDIKGAPVQFYRVRLLNPNDGIKYRQSSKEANHIYFPKGFDIHGEDYVIITEGEKKAACAVKSGFKGCVAVSGVDSWRNRTLALPKDTKLESRPNTGQLLAKVPSGDSEQTVQMFESSTLAEGMQDLIDACVRFKKQVIIIYDSDEDGGCKLEVQRAAARLGYELRYRGLPLDHIRQLVLPSRGSKVGLDD